MRSRFKWLLPLIAFAPLLMAPSGGYPSFPTFQAVTITPAAGLVAQTINSASATNFARNDYQLGGTIQGIMGVAGATNDLITGSAQNDFNIRTQGGAIGLSTNSGASTTVKILGAGGGMTVTGPTSGTGVAGKFDIPGATASLQNVQLSASGATAAVWGLGLVSASAGFGISRVDTGPTTYLTVFTDGGVAIGAPTGGDPGIGSINATGVFSGGVQLIPTKYVSSSATTTRTSTTTQSCDANLTMTLTANNKLVAMHAQVNFDQNASTTNGIKLGFGVTGTAAVIINGLIIGDQSTSSGTSTPVSQCMGGACGVFTETDASTGTNNRGITLDGVLSTASSGSTTICINWAQATSNATNTRLNGGYMSATQLN